MLGCFPESVEGKEIINILSNRKEYDKKGEINHSYTEKFESCNSFVIIPVILCQTPSKREQVSK